MPSLQICKFVNVYKKEFWWNLMKICFSRSSSGYLLGQAVPKDIPPEFFCWKKETIINLENINEVNDKFTVFMSEGAQR